MEIPTRSDVHLWWASLAAAATEDGASLLDEAEVARAATFTAAPDRDRFVARRALLRTVLGRYSGFPPAGLRLRAGADGKPECPDLPELAFNSSSSGSTAVVAV